MIHLLFLHQTGSNNPLGIISNLNKIPFHPYYTYKDIFGFTLLLTSLMAISFFGPDLLGDPENYIPANPYKTPLHIQPEWYFLFAYAILRRVPNKGGGVAALAGSVLVLYLIPFRAKYFHLGLAFYPLSQVYYWIFVSRFLILTFVGIRPVQEPYQVLGQVGRLVYFRYYPLHAFLERG